MLKHIRAKNIKSFESLDLSLHTNIMCCLGKNGSGKSSLFYLISFFFQHLGDQFSSEIIIDSSNPYIQEGSITIDLDIEWLKQHITSDPELKSRVQHIIDALNLKSSCQAIQIKMTQDRLGKIQWNIPKEELSKISEYLKRFFPVWKVSVRSLDIHSWDLIWEIMGDLIRCDPHIDQLSKLDTTLGKIYDQYPTLRVEINRVLKEEGISVDQYKYKNKFSDILKMRLGGDTFTIHDKSLRYYSDGTNSFEYLRLLLSLIPLISEYSMRYPIILIDEPEIGLHYELITDFVKDVERHISCVKSAPAHAQLFLASHSPKLIEVLTTHNIQFELFRMSNFKLHTKINQMNLDLLRSGKHTITPRETECYFADYIVYVEGETEIQLFHNPYLQLLFPKLNKIHFYPGCANIQQYNNVNSKDLNLGIPYRIMIDMDKVIALSQKDISARTCFYTKKSSETLSPLRDDTDDKKGRYSYQKNMPHPVKPRNITEKNSIEQMLSKKYTLCQDYINDSEFETLLTLIQKYSRRQATLVNRWTIEGELITAENFSIFEQFLNECLNGNIQSCDVVNNIQKKKNALMMLMNISDMKERIALTVYCAGGSLITKKGRNDYIIIKTALPKNMFGGKTSRWIDLWLDYYFSKNTSLTLTATPNKSTIAAARHQFSKDFPSLYDNILSIEKMVND